MYIVGCSVNWYICSRLVFLPITWESTQKVVWSKFNRLSSQFRVVPSLICEYGIFRRSVKWSFLFLYVTMRSILFDLPHSVLRNHARIWFFFSSSKINQNVIQNQKKIATVHFHCPLCHCCFQITLSLDHTEEFFSSPYTARRYTGRGTEAKRITQNKQKQNMYCTHQE